MSECRGHGTRDNEFEERAGAFTQRLISGDLNAFADRAEDELRCGGGDSERDSSGSGSACATDVVALDDRRAVAGTRQEARNRRLYDRVAGNKPETFPSSQQ